MVKCYFEVVCKNRPDKPLPLPHLKFLKSLAKDFLYCRWADDDISRSDVFCPLKILVELCTVYNGIKNPIVGYSMFFFIFNHDKNPKKSDLEIILSGAVSFPSPLILESATLFILAHNLGSKGPIEFRLGSTIFSELCNIIPNGIETLYKLPQKAPYFCSYIFFSICRKLANKLRSVVPLRAHHTTVTKIDGCPSSRVLAAIIHYLKTFPELTKGDRVPDFIDIPDIYAGEVKQFPLPKLHTFDDLAHIAVGYSMWLPVVKVHHRKETEPLFLEFYQLIIDILTTLETNNQIDPIQANHEYEDGELEQGELVDDVEMKESTDITSSYLRLVSFVCRIVEYEIVSREQFDSIIERLAQILKISYQTNSILVSDLNQILIQIQTLPSNSLLSQVISLFKTKIDTCR
ncbi:hypothetical protein RF11_10814 [Thelohanellus kitauei]|uniref:Uncharacterized protein n=1 Tax=Thelohanellus kitauei TaxID=669202 RepID=A0A0C2MMK2_THEKT|nr:hypothetical protein RF11_10814 [Thelohanellus kitauei]